MDLLDGSILSVVTCVIIRYTDEQAAIQAKQRMLREDWEFFSAQRKILKEQIMKNHHASGDSPDLSADDGSGEKLPCHSSGTESNTAHSVSTSTSVSTSGGKW